MVDRVRRPKEFEGFMSKLRGDEGDDKVFNNYKDCIIFCAALCAKRGKNFKESFDDSSEPVLIQVFHGEYDNAFINALAIFDTGDAMVISPDRQDERIRILEEYACGGLRLLESELSPVRISAEEQVIAILKKDVPENIINDIRNFNVAL